MGGVRTAGNDEVAYARGAVALAGGWPVCPCSTRW